MDVTKIALRQENGRLVVSYQPTGGQWRACLSLLPETLGDGSHVVELNDKAPPDELPKSLIVQTIPSKSEASPGPAVATAVGQLGEEITRIAGAIAKDGDAQLHKRIDEVLDMVQARMSRTLEHVRIDIEKSEALGDQRFAIMKGRTEALRSHLVGVETGFDDRDYLRQAEKASLEVAEGDGVSGG